MPSELSREADVEKTGILPLFKAIMMMICF
jgi:hypothetical protein